MIFPIKLEHSANKDSFAYWENFLSDEDITYLLNDNSWENTSPARIGGRAVNEQKINYEIRSTNISWLYPNNENIHIWEKISQVTSKVNNNFFKFTLTGFYEPMQLGLYSSENNGHYDWHTDADVNDLATPRKLSMVLLLSDPSEFEGGELQLKIGNDKPITVELKKGRAWFFPSYVLHKVTPVTKGVRKSVVLWVGGPEFK